MHMTNANSENPDQKAPVGALGSVTTLFAKQPNHLI